MCGNFLQKLSSFSIFKWFINFSTPPKLLNLPRSVNQFSIDLYDQILSHIDNDQNIVLSPLSIHLALGLALMAADGQTAKEILKELHLGQFNSATIAVEYKKLLDSLKDQVTIANKIYVSNYYHIKTPFKGIALNNFISEIENEDFANVDNVTNVINAWMEAKTENQIQNVVSPEYFGDLTRLVLVNAIHFKGSWEHPFHPSRTYKWNFYNTKNNIIQIDMMHQDERFPYVNISELDAQMIIMNFNNNQSDLSMVILLPNEIEGLDEMDRKLKLKTVNLSDILKSVGAEKNVRLTLPKFKAEFEIKLSGILSEMGMPTMFSETEGEFSGLIEERSRICVDHIIHKAFIEVNEAGAAEASTTADFDFVFDEENPVETIEFYADHPFRYLIRNRDNLVLFEGCFRHGVTSCWTYSRKTETVNPYYKLSRDMRKHKSLNTYNF